MKEVKITAFIKSEWQARCLAEFCKRASFDTAYNHSDGGDEDKRKSMAYEILEGLNCIQKALADSGFSVR